MGIEGFPQVPAPRHDVPQQPLTTAPFQAAVPFASASHHRTQSFQSYTASFSGTPLRPRQPLTTPGIPSVTEPEHLPYQQLYSPFPGPAEMIPQQQVVGSRLVQQTAATSRLAHYPPPAVKPLEPDFHHLPAANSRHLADEFPFCYSVSKELPHIFGNLEDDKVLEHPLTPSFEPLIEREPWWDTMEIQPDLYYSSPASFVKEDFVHNASPSRSHVQPSNLNSCCFGSTQMSSLSLLTELPSGLISKGKSFSIDRQN